jgi:hypothetical protein
MDIREWFEVRSDSKSLNSSLDSLFSLYINAISKYFSCEEARTVTELVAKADQSHLTAGERMFLDWFVETGLPCIRRILSMDLPNNHELFAQLDYERYILEEEMDFRYPDDVRSSLVNIVSDLPTRIETASSSESVYTGEFTYKMILDEGYELLNTLVTHSNLPNWQVSLF